MTHRIDATVFVYRHLETGAVKALYVEDALALDKKPDFVHVATLEPRMWIEYYFDLVTKNAS